MLDHVTYGRKPVLELLQTSPQRVRKVSVAEGVRGAAMRELVAAARAAGISVQYVPRRALDRKADGGVHQGVVAETQAVETCTLRELLDQVDMHAPPLLVACDGVTDPHNLGAIARSAAAAGADGLMLPTRGSAPLTGSVEKAAAGALDHLPIAAVGNLTSALPECKDRGFWVVGTAREGDVGLYEADLTVPLVLVFGSEGAGLRPGVRKQCDVTVTIPIAETVDSLNVSVAAGVLLFEAVRQRRGLADG